MIEPILHQIWHPFACLDLPREWERFSRGWRRLHPDHRYMRWGTEESRAFVAAEFPGLLGAYDGYASPMKRVAALRYLLLAHFGGVYVDLDMECLRNVEPLLAGQDLVFASEPEAQWPRDRQQNGAPVISPAFMASQARHPFWSSVVEELQRSADVPGVAEGAGALLLTRCYDRYPERTAVTLAPPELFNPAEAPACEDGTAYELQRWLEVTRRSYAVHHWGATWRRPGMPAVRASRLYHHGLPVHLRHPRWASASPGQLFHGGPTVSCIMVTRGWTYPARWAIEAFRNQSYSNRELIIATTNRDGDLRAHVEALRDPRIRYLDVLPQGMPLGAQRNAAIDAAAGELVCTWDDDDLYGVDRLATAVTAMATTNAAAAFLERVHFWWPARQQLAISRRRAWENTMVARKAILARYPELDKGEDTAVAAALFDKHPVVVIDDPHLYTYVIWGANTWGPDHFELLLRHVTFEVARTDYDRSLSVLDKHVPVLEYLAWLEERDPRSFLPDAASPAPLSASPPPPRDAASPTPRLVPATAAVPTASEARPLRFLLAWEIGAGFGHMVPLAQIARPLLDAGHEVHLALHDLSTARAGLGDLAAHPRLRLWQSPHWAVPLQGTGDPASYAELLFRAGYLDAHKLTGLVDGWDTLVRQLKPDLVLAEHAPTCLLACRGRRVPRAVVGSGFFVPQRASPIPSFREWEAIPLARVEQAEARVLETCNEILAARGAPALESLAELALGDEQFLITVPELDYYPERAKDPGQRYYGALSPAAHGRPAAWPSGTEPAVFAYIRGEYRGAEQALLALASGPWRVLAFVPGFSPARAAELSTPKLRIVFDPVDMSEVTRSCEAVVCNSGSGTVTTVLHAGKPLVMLPLHVEQYLIARRIQGLGAGLVVLDDRLDQLSSCIGRVAGEPGFRDAARAFARRYSTPQGNEVARTIAARCVELALREVAREAPRGQTKHEPKRGRR